MPVPSDNVTAPQATLVSDTTAAAGRPTHLELVAARDDRQQAAKLLQPLVDERPHRRRCRCSCIGICCCGAGCSLASTACPCGWPACPTFCRQLCGTKPQVALLPVLKLAGNAPLLVAQQAQHIALPAMPPSVAAAAADARGGAAQQAAKQLLRLLRRQVLHLWQVRQQVRMPLCMLRQACGQRPACLASLCHSSCCPLHLSRPLLLSMLRFILLHWFRLSSSSGPCRRCAWRPPAA